MKTKITRLTVLLLSLIIASCGEGGSGGGSSGKALIPSAPTELKATAGNASVSLSWTSSEAKHRIHYATESFAGKGDYSSASGYGKKDVTSGTSADVTGLTNGTKYYFVVTALKDGKESNASNEVSSTPAKPAVALPSAPTELKATAGDASVSLNWTSSEASHRIHYATESFAGKGDYSLASGYGNKEITSGTSTDVTGLTNGTHYYFVVTAIKDGKESNASHEVSSTPAKPAVAKASTLNDTGITWGGGYSSGNNADCSSNIAAEQDCHQGRDAQAAAGKLVKKGGGKAGFDFTRLNNDGSEYTGSGDYDQAPWSCVRDNVTGLVWEVKTKSGTADTEADIQAGKSLNIHHKDNRYRWGGVTAIGRTHAQKEGDYYDDWNALVNGSNTARLCGFNDWRVPKREELISVVDYGKHSPSIDADYFPNTTSDWFWSASPYAYYYYNAWVVYFNNGYDYNYTRNYTYRVRLVRGGQ